MTNLPAFNCPWEHHGRADFQDHTVTELLEHLLENDRTIIEKENRIMTDLSGIQQDEQDLGAAQAQESSDVVAALQALEAAIPAAGTVVTQAQIDALRTPLQAAIASAQGTDAAAKAATPAPAPAPAPAPGA